MKFSYSILLLFISILFLSSCSFNKMFLQPTVAPIGAKKMTLRSKQDTTVVYFSPETHQPTFSKNGKDTIDLGFTIEGVVFKSENGHLISGWMMKPKNITASITLLHLHGNAGFLLSQYGAVSPLIKNGFQIFIFDYSGFGFSEGKATRKNVLTDALSALTYVKSRSDVKNTKLVLYGQSLGGHLAAVVAQKREADIDALVIEGAFSSHKDIGAHTVPVLGRIFIKEGYSAKKSIAKFHKPVIIIHSTEDKTIPFLMGEKLFKAANEPKFFYQIKQCHICGPEYYTDEISDKIKVLFANNEK